MTVPTRLIALLLLTGCAVPGLSGPYTTDEDGDGLAELDGDCDDTDPAVGPHAVEVCDGIDNNCDGNTDSYDPALSAPAWYRDLDGDGLGIAEDSVRACRRPPAYAPLAGDCDDTDYRITHGDLWYPDEDGDGFGGADGWRHACEQPDGFVADDLDCDDTDPARNPDATERLDGHDDECNGLVDDLGLADLDAHLWGEEGSGLGGAVAGGADLDGDGLPDAVVGAAGVGGGRVLVLGASRREGWRIAAELTGSDLDRAGSSLAVLRDATGDGRPDLLVGGESAAWLVSSPLASGPLDEVGTRLEGVGRVVGTGDGDGDGLADLVLAEPYAGEDAVWVFRQPLLALHATDEAEVVVERGHERDWAGAAVTSLDLDGDGLDELVVAAPRFETESTIATEWDTVAGRVCVLSGAASGRLAMSDGEGCVTGVDTAVGWSVAALPDTDGDGLDELVVGGFGSTEERAWLLRGDPSAWGRVDRAADAVLVADLTGVVYTTVAAAGDPNGDGRADVLVGLDGSAPTSSARDGARIVLGPLHGTIDLEAVASVEGDGIDGLGAALAGIGDLDGDGLDDLVLGAPAHGGESGAAALLLGRAFD